MRPRWQRLLLILASLGVAALALRVADDIAVQTDTAGHCANPEARRSMVDFQLGLLAPVLQVETREGQDRFVRGPLFETAVPDVPVARTPGVRRLAIVGESSGDSFASSLLGCGGACDGTLELIAATRGGIATEHLRLLLEEARRTRPDVVLLVTGNNTAFRFVTDPWRLQLARVATHSCLLTRLVLPVEAPTDRTRRTAERLEAYRAFLDDARRAAVTDGFQLVVATLPTNAWVPPGTPPGRAVVAALIDEAAGRPEEALRQLEAAPSTSEGAAFVRGRVLARLGRTEDAGRSLLEAIRLDPSIERANERVREIQRAAAIEPAKLFDLAAMVEAASAPNLPGWESFFDPCHLTTTWFDRAATELMPRIGPACPCAAKMPPALLMLRLLLGVARTTPTHGPADLPWAYAIEAAVHQDTAPLTQLLAWLSEAERAGTPAGAAVVRAGVALGLASRGEREAARALVEGLPDGDQADWNLLLGLARLATDTPGARRLLLAAIQARWPAGTTGELVGQVEERTRAERP